MKTRKTTFIQRVQKLSNGTIPERSTGLGWALVLFVVALLGTFPFEKRIQVEGYPKVNEVANRDVIAPYSFNVLKSDSVLEKERKAARETVLLIFDKDSATTQRVSAYADSLSSLLISVGRMDSLIVDTIPAETLFVDSGEFEVHPQKVVRRRNASYFDALGQLKEQELYPLLKAPEYMKSFHGAVTHLLDKGIISVVVVDSLTKMERYVKKNKGKDFKYIVDRNRFLEVVSGEIHNNVSLDSVMMMPQLYDTISAIMDVNSVVKPGPKVKLALWFLIDLVVRPNVVYNRGLTETRKADKASEVKELIMVVDKSWAIVNRHEKVTEEQAQILAVLEEIENKNSTKSGLLLFMTNGSSIVLLCGISILLFFFVCRYIPSSMTSGTYFLAMAVMIAGQLIVIRLAFLYSTLNVTAEEGVVFSSIFNGIPMTIAVLLAAILFNRESGFFLAVFFAIYIGIIYDFNLISTIDVLISGGVAAYIGNSIRYRKDFVYLVFWLLLVNGFVVLFAVIAGQQELTWERIGQIAIFSIVDAVLSVLFVNLLLPMFESRFNFTTDMTLMELSDMSNKLLKKLSIEASGTYNHSILVANLAESAADEIGANSLLCRVASYYHDIGKMVKKSTYFIENQRNKKNPHDAMPPQRSVKIIMDHVKDGVKLAEEYKLPKIIVSAIQEHHGDALMTYFYYKAQDSEDITPEMLNKSDFSYAGPKPQTVENAIIMMADSIEAASRTFKGSTVKELRELIKKIIYQKIEYGQLDECGLTFDEVNRIVNGFLRILQGVFHSRIEYKETEESNN